MPFRLFADKKKDTVAEANQTQGARSCFQWLCLALRGSEYTMKKHTARGDSLLPEEVADRLNLSRYTVMVYYREGILRAWMKDKKGTPRFRWDWVQEDLAKLAGVEAE